jgi:hypothetical protein
MRRVASLLFLLGASRAWAADVFVSPTGDDTAVGSAAAPLRTLPVALARAQPGDVVRLRAGSYLGGPITKQATAAAPIRVVSEDGPQKAILENSDQPLHVTASSWLVFDGLEVRNSISNTVRIDTSHDLTLSNLFAHDAGLDGDVILISQSQRITLDNVEAARPGQSATAQIPPFRENVELVNVDDSSVRSSFIHDGGATLLLIRGDSQNVVVERNVIGDQRDAGDADPAVGLGGVSDLATLQGAQFEVTNLIFRNNIVYRAAHGALGIFDAQHVAVADNLFVDVDQVVVAFKDGGAPAPGSDDVRFANNLFVDTRGRMPAPFNRITGGLTNFTASFDVYWNAGQPVPPSLGVAIDATETGRLTTDPGVAAPQAFTSSAQAIAALQPSPNGSAAVPGRDVSGAPYFVVDDIRGRLRGARRDRGPYLLGNAGTGADGGTDGGTGGGMVGGGFGGGALPPREGCACELGAAPLASATPELVGLVGLGLLALLARALRRRRR